MKSSAAEKIGVEDVVDTSTGETVVTEATTDEIPWSQAPAKARKEQLGKIFVERDITKKVIALIDSARSDRLLYAEAQNVAIIGETGVGKSEIAKRYLADNPESIDPETGNVIRPVLYVNVRHSSTPKSVAKAMARMLLLRGGIEDPDDPDAEEMTQDEEAEDKECYASNGTSDLTHMVKRQMVGQRVEVAFLDEFHNTITDNGAVRLNRIAEWVKDFAKSKDRTARHPDGRPEENIAIVLIGTRRVNNVLNATVNPELSGITPYRIEITRYEYRTDEQKVEFRQFLDDLDLELPFDEDSRLGQVDDQGQAPLADKIHLATFGFLRQLGHIVMKAAELAIDDGSAKILEHHLHQAVELKRGVLEAALVSEDSEGDERRVVENPFMPPAMRPKAKDRKRSGFSG